MRILKFLVIIFFGAYCGFASEYGNIESIQELTDEDYDEEIINPEAMDETYDPLEPFNRLVFKLNNGLDVVLIEPLTKMYDKFVPQVLANSVSNFVSNVLLPMSFANYVLQGDPNSATRIVFRFLINTSLGFFGAFDVASKLKISAPTSGFGDTLKKWGAKPGPYIVLPILGSKSLRSLVGSATEFAVLNRTNEVILMKWRRKTRRKILCVFCGIDLFLTRVKLSGMIKDLKATSVDYYVATREFYMATQK